MAKYTSGRVKKFPQSGITSDRYEFLGLEQAEPDLGNPVVGVASTGAKPHPSLFDGNHYSLISTTDEIGSRYWAEPADLYNVKISSDTTTNQNWYVAISSVTSGSQPGVFVSPDKFQINPFTGGAYISGSLGIGNVNPGEKLQVDGNIRVGNSIFENYIAFRGTNADNQTPYTHTFIGERMYDYNERSELYERSELLLFKGNDVPDANGPDRIRLAAGEFRFDTINTDTSGTFEQVATSPNVTNKMILTGNGNLGIGTTTPSDPLDVNGNIRLRSGLKDYYGTVGVAGSILSSTGVGVSWVSPYSVSVVDDTSTNATYYVGYSTVTSGVTTSFGISSTKLQFNPSTGTLTATIFNSLSDEYLKENIKTIKNPIEKISAINGVSFNWMKNGSPSIGLIAQEVEKVFPELVDGKEFKSINYDGLVGVLVECIKDLQAQINSLKNP